MHTWWIIEQGGRIIITVYSGYRNAIGPYWTPVEALQMISKWRRGKE